MFRQQVPARGSVRDDTGYYINLEAHDLKFAILQLTFQNFLIALLLNIFEIIIYNIIR